jgi:hypothetical protein
MVNVICMKWGTLYGPEYVNRLFDGVRRHLRRPLRFVCFTDDGRGLLPGVECLALPSTGSPDTQDTRWRKLALFREGLADLGGPTLFLDLDVVVVGTLDPFFEAPGDFMAIRDAQLFPDRWARKLFRPRREAFYQRVANTSVFRFEAGTHGDLLARYNREHAKIIAEFRNEQEYLSAHLHAQRALGFWPAEWCVSFKHDCVPGRLRSFFADPACPATALIVVFAGSPKMSEVLGGGGGRWYRRIGPGPWLTRAWTGTP